MATIRLSPEQLDELRELHRQLAHKQEAYRVNVIISLGMVHTSEKNF